VLCKDVQLFIFVNLLVQELSKPSNCDWLMVLCQSSEQSTDVQLVLLEEEGNPLHQHLEGIRVRTDRGNLLNQIQVVNLEVVILVQLPRELLKRLAIKNDAFVLFKALNGFVLIQVLLRLSHTFCFFLSLSHFDQECLQVLRGYLSVEVFVDFLEFFDHKVLFVHGVDLGVEKFKHLVLEIDGVLEGSSKVGDHLFYRDLVLFVLEL
jgi:hypothetical protein